MVHWSKKAHGKALAELFEKNLADPKAASCDQVDKHWKLDKVFEEIPMNRFRDNCRKLAATWIRGEGLQGMRLRDISTPEKPGETKPAEPEDDPAPDEEEQSPLEEPEPEPEPEDEEEEPPPEVMPTPAKAITTKPSTGACKHKDNERKWQAVCQSCKFISKGHCREELMVEPPASFSGEKGTCEASFDSNSKVFVLKIAPNPALSDPHHVNSWHNAAFGITVADDSARMQSFTKASQELRDKWCTFRHPLSWQGKPSGDLGLLQWIEFVDFEAEGRICPVIVINISSIDPVEEKLSKTSESLVRRKTFVSPPKAVGVRFAGDQTAQMAFLMEQMLKSGFTADMMTGKGNKQNTGNPTPPETESTSMEEDEQTADSNAEFKKQRTGGVGTRGNGTEE